jgi:competence protein ComEA
MLMWVAALCGTPLAQAGPGAQLPEAEGRETVIAVCSDCHDVDVVAAQRRSRVEWQEIVQEMAGRSGTASDEDVQAIVRYVVASFGRVNVNRAAERDLVDIVELSASEASAIVEFRMREGEFGSLEDLRKVPGLDFARVQERKDRIVFTGP